MRRNSPLSFVASSIALFIVSGSPLLADVPPAFRPSPEADEKGFIDVWQLRADVAAVESLMVSDDTEGCFPEGDPDHPPPQKEIERQDRASAACVAQVHAGYMAYQNVWRALNSAWLPLIREAIRRGDRVAEVIMRQCDTTPVLDRAGIEATCDPTEPRREIARARLKKIGFVPAFDMNSELLEERGMRARPDAQERNQALILDRVRAGALAFDDIRSGAHGGNLFKNQRELAMSLRWAVIEAVAQDAPTAFTVSPGGGHAAGWATEAFDTLRLNRKPLTPGFMTWGPALHFSGGNDVYTGYNYWRVSPKRIFDANDQRALVILSGPGAEPPHRSVIAGAGTPEFERERAEVLANIEASIKRYLTEDPRWGVFLLHRIGHHEWEPTGVPSTTHLLDSAWEGTWALEKETRDWTKPMAAAAGNAVIERTGDSFQITVTANSNEDPLLNVERCALRYSGASTYPPTVGPAGQNPMGTVFGYMASQSRLAGVFDREGENTEAVAPLDPTKRYRQVLMLCPKAESLDSARLRFLLLAGDILVEVGATDPFGGQLAVRHYRRRQ
jgi:hypothetical protein